jgi:hypothetical protein
MLLKWMRRKSRVRQTGKFPIPFALSKLKKNSSNKNRVWNLIDKMQLKGFPIGKESDVTTRTIVGCIPHKTIQMEDLRGFNDISRNPVSIVLVG